MVAHAQQYFLISLIGKVLLSAWLTRHTHTHTHTDLQEHQDDLVPVEVDQPAAMITDIKTAADTNHPESTADKSDTTKRTNLSKQDTKSSVPLGNKLGYKKRAWRVVKQQPVRLTAEQKREQLESKKLLTPDEKLLEEWFSQDALRWWTDS